MISSGQWTYVLIKMLINNNSHKEIQIIQELTTLILCNLSFLLFQTIQYAQFFYLKPWRIPINSYFQVLCAVIARYTTAVSYYHTGSSCPNHILLIMSMTILYFAVTKEWFLPSENYSNCLAAFSFLVISKFCCLWWLIYMPFGNSKSRKQGIHHFWKGLCARRYLCLVFQRH